MPKCKRFQGSKSLGFFSLRFHGCQLVVEYDNSNGQFYTNPGDNNEPMRIRVGLAGSWDDTVAVFTHELMEASCTLSGARFNRSFDSRDAASYWFFFDHSELSLIAEDIGHALAAMLPALADEFNAYHKAKKGGSQNAKA